jgi:hypothetical protein
MQQSPGNEQLIPRVIHRLWLGTKQPPAIFEHYERSWRRHHPSWELCLWRDETLPAQTAQAEYDATESQKKRFDMARLEILRQFGGVFIDMDCEAIRPLDPLLGGVSAFLGRLGRHHVGSQVMGAIPHHPFFELAVARLAASVRAGGTTNKVAGKAFLERVLAECPDGVTLFPEEAFYFEPSFEPPKHSADFPDVYVVHHSLATYSGLPEETAMAHRVEKFRRQVAVALADLERDHDLTRTQAQLAEAQQRLLRGIRKHEQAFRIQYHRLEAEREVAEAQLREAQMDARERIEALEARSLLLRLRKVAAGLRLWS